MNDNPQNAIKFLELLAKSVFQSLEADHGACHCQKRFVDVVAGEQYIYHVVSAGYHGFSLPSTVSVIVIR